MAHQNLPHLEGYYKKLSINLLNKKKGEHEKPWGNHRMARHLGLEYSILLSHPRYPAMKIYVIKVAVRGVSPMV
ncbi:TPA: hypothetical protein ACWV7H_005061 [Salmonella enterica subsp. enterica serovar Muenchen]